MNDLQKLYVLSDQKFNELKPYIKFSLRQQYKSETYPKSSLRVQSQINVQRIAQQSIDINLADSLSWDQLKGIGPTFSRRIVNYRKKLGGFYHPAQLLEVYGIDSALYLQILPFLNVNKQDVELININQANYEQLRQHPYIGPKSAQILINYIRQNGPIKSIDDLKKVLIFDAETITKISAYLKF